MSAKSKLNGVPPAGIFSDMTVDGPEIGTLVLIVDRAKNLPNRKSIGKQDPYCAARLGKEAKKTKTDIRGGQTPRWDQELRFVVHDSADYYQLKVSVFHDDKKTDLIGESWIDLKDIIVPGGGQNDLWHNLSCRGKYAGEIRIELTYYDSRRKPEKPAQKPRPAEVEAPQKLRGPVKRRPLPSDPVPAPAGVSAPAPAVDDPHPKEVVGARAMPDPPRPQPKGPVAYIPAQSALQAIEYSSPAPQRQHPTEDYAPAPQPTLPPATSSSYAPRPPAQLENSPRPPPVHHESQSRSPRRRHTDMHSPSPHLFDDMNDSPKYLAQTYEHHDVHGKYISAPEPYQPPPIDDHEFQFPPDDEPPPPPPVHRSRTNSSHELMARGGYDTTSQKGTLPMRYDVLKNEAHRNSFSAQSRPVYRAYDGSSGSGSGSGSGSFHQASGDAYDAPSPRHQSYDAAYDAHDPHHRSMQPMAEDAPGSSSPGAPPHGYHVSDAHRRMSHQPHDMGYDENPTPAPLNLSGRGSAASGHYSLPQPPSPRPSPPEQNGYAPASSAVSAVSSDHQIAAYRPPPPPPAHHPGTLDRANGHHSPGKRSPSMDHGDGYREHSPVPPGHGTGFRDHSPSVSTSHSHAYREHSPSVSATHSNGYRERSPSGAPPEPPMQGYGSNSNLESPEQGASTDQDMSTALVPRNAYHASNHHGNGSYHGELDDTQVARPSSYSLPHVPPSLVPGVDPALAREVSERIYEERRRQRTQSAATPPTGRSWTEAPIDYINGGGSAVSYVPPPQHHQQQQQPPHQQQHNNPQQQQQQHQSQHQHQQSFDGRSSVGYSNAGTPARTRGASKSPSPLPSPQPSPNPNHTIKRKSVSPAPPPSERRSGSEVPFGPDSYDALNPAFSAIQNDPAQADPDAKIITYDGREVDPSDHLPMESWAPEPKPRDKSHSNPSADDRDRERGFTPTRSAQPPPPLSQSGGRRPLRIAGRPQSMAGPASYAAPDEHPRTPPAATGRNRLQKKADRMSALPLSSGGSSPLAPISSHGYNMADGGGSGFTPGRPARASTWGDYGGENHAPQYGSSPGAARGMPALPAKVPIPTMSGALVVAGPGAVAGREDMALMEEMKRIDIGAGRSRRHGGY